MFGEISYKLPGVNALNDSNNQWLITAPALTTASTLNTIGTITTGTWNGTTITPNHGGTGIVSVPTNGQLLIGNGTNYTAATLTAGLNTTITNGVGTITIAQTYRTPDIYCYSYAGGI